MENGLILSVLADIKILFNPSGKNVLIVDSKRKNNQFKGGKKDGRTILLWYVLVCTFRASLDIILTPWFSLRTNCTHQAKGTKSLKTSSKIMVTLQISEISKHRY